MTTAPVGPVRSTHPATLPVGAAARSQEEGADADLPVGRHAPRPWGDTLGALLRRIPNATPALPDLNGLLAILHPLPLRRPPGDPELLALREGERARRHVRRRPLFGGAA